MSRRPPPSVEALAALALNAASPELVVEVVRTAYALGYFDAGVDSIVDSVANRERRSAESSVVAQ